MKGCLLLVEVLRIDMYHREIDLLRDLMAFDAEIGVYLVNWPNELF